MFHRSGLLVLTFVGGFTALLALLLILGGPTQKVRADPGDLYVASDGNCGGASPCYDNVQAAVDAAVGGDVIKVAQGTYTDVSARDGVTQVVYISKTLTVRGGYAITDWSTSYPLTQPTTLDAQGQGRVLYISGNIAPLIEGLRITGGQANGTPGGGVYIDHATATIKDSVVFSNTAKSGGGLSLHRSDATLHGNVISGNVATERGGGVSVAQGEAWLDGNTVVANEADYGGGLWLYWGHNTLTNNIVAENRASSGGSGLHIEDSSANLVHNTIARNLGGDGVGVYIWLTDFPYNSISLTNTILVSHTVGIYCAVFPPSPAHRVDLEATLWGSGAWANETDSAYLPPFSPIHTGTINLWAPPAFVDPEGGDYHISPGSAAVDAGVDAGVSSDVDGDMRPMAFGFDIGADEALGAGLRLQKVATFPAVNPGGIVTYTLSVTSAGAYSATNVWLTDTLPTLQRTIAVTMTRGSCTAGYDWGGDVACDLGDMTSGERAVITLTAQVTATLPPRPLRLMRNTARVTSTTTMSHTAHADVAMQDCYVRLNDSPVNYATVQAAVDASTQPVDVVKIAGYCTGAAWRNGVAQIVYLSKTLTLQGGWNTSFTQWNVISYPTTLDALDQGRVLYITGDISPTVEGLNITGGSAASLDGYSSGGDAGGGIYVMTATAIISGNRILTNTAAFGYGGGVHLSFSDAMVSNNFVGYNTASFGGGLALDHCDKTMLSGNIVISNTVDVNGGGLWIVTSPAALDGNLVISNTSHNDGGGLYLAWSDATINNNTIAGNTTGGWGGGLHLLHSAALLSNNTITANSVDNKGGGIHLYSSPATLISNTISGNESNCYGGGLHLEHSHATLRGNILVANRAGCYGGGLNLWMSDATLVNNVIADNWAAVKGSGLDIDTSSPQFLHTTIARNTGGDGSGIYIESEPGSYFSIVTFTNTVLVSQTVGIYITAGNTATLEATLWGDGAWANGTDWTGAGTIVTSAVNVWDDPAFVNPNAGNYHISAGSAAIDKGVSAGVTDDIDGDPRPLGDGYDIGADEFKDPALVVAQWVAPDPVLTGEQITYTIHITNTGNITLTLAITDVLPAHVAPTGVLTWTDVSLPPGDVWQQTVPTTVTLGYEGQLTNVVVVAAVGGAAGYAEISSDVVKYSVYLPLVQVE